MNSFPVYFYVGYVRVLAWTFVWEGAGIFFYDRQKLAVENVSFTGAVALEEVILVFK